ncbi:MAG: hypothetical protein WC136_00385 [Sphaerochaeta sp.]|jgi:ribosome-associated translation inhibitor RaiA
MKLLQFIIDLLKKFFTKGMPVSKQVETTIPVKDEDLVDPNPTIKSSTPYKTGKYSDDELLVLQRIVDGNLEGEDLDKAIKKACDDLNRPIKNLKTKIKNMKRS